MHRSLAIPILALASLLAGCDGKPERSALEEIRERGTLRVALEVGYEPFEMATVDGDYIGYDIELARALARHLGVEVEFLNTQWDGIIGQLQADRADCIISGMSIDEERRRAVDFSEPYYEVGQCLLVPLARKDEVEGPADLDRAGVVITTQSGTTGEKAARELFKKATVRAFERVIEAALEVKNGRADALLFDSPFVLNFAADNPESLHAVEGLLTKEPIGIAIKQGSEDLLAEVNAFLTKARNEGLLAELEKKYFQDRHWRERVKKE